MAKNFTDGTGRSSESNDADDLGKIDQIQGGEEFEERLWFTADGVYALERLAYENGEEFRDCQEVTPHEAAAWLRDNGFNRHRKI